MTDDRVRVALEALLSTAKLVKAETGEAVLMALRDDIQWAEAALATASPIEPLVCPHCKREVKHWNAAAPATLPEEPREPLRESDMTEVGGLFGIRLRKGDSSSGVLAELYTEDDTFFGFVEDFDALWLGDLAGVAKRAAERQKGEG